MKRIKRSKKQINSRKCEGFTLIELMIGVGIFVMMTVTVYTVMTGGRRAWVTSEAQIDVHDSARRIMQTLTEEIAEAAPGYLTITNISSNEDRIIFQTPSAYAGGSPTWGDRIQYSLGGQDGEQIVRTNIDQATSESFGDYVTTMRFTQPAADLVLITLLVSRQSVVGDTMQMQLVSQVSLRNR
ncbi:MAG: type II secretion system protein [PVC group bacterium]|nr:type II secretion system protein [PVC group bacterium]